MACAAACGLFPNLDGLSASDAAPGDTGADVDADAGVLCEGGVHVTSFDGFVPSGDASIDSGVVTATVTTPVSGHVSAYVERDFSTTPSSVRLAYDGTFEPSVGVYAEEGCTLYLFDAQNNLMLRYVVNESGTDANGASELGDSVNGALADGGQSNVYRKVGIVSASGSHHVDVTVSNAGASGTLSSTFDGQTRQDDLLFPSAVTTVTVQCGITYASTYPVGGDGGTLTTQLANPDITVCP